jgi:hypothetical protein
MVVGQPPRGTADEVGEGAARALDRRPAGLWRQIAEVLRAVLAGVSVADLAQHQGEGG